MRHAWLALLVWIIAGPAFAQEYQRDYQSYQVRPVTREYQPEQQPLGIRAPGQFLLFPHLELLETYDDNIFRTDGNEESDFITQVQPGLRAQSDWNRHQVTLLATGDLGYYADNSDEDYEDYRVEARGRLDILRETYLSGLVRHEHLHEERGSPDDPGGDEPTEFDVTTARIGFTRALARLQLDTLLQQQQYDFEDSSASGVNIDNDARDREINLLESTLSYELHPYYDVFLRGRLNERRYDESAAADRDSEGYEAIAGGAIDISGKARGEVYAGYLRQDYDAIGDTVGAVNYGGSLLWNVTGLTSLLARVERQVNETTIDFATAFIRTRYLLGAEHALYRDVFLLAEGEHVFDDYESNIAGVDREDDFYRGGLAAEYRLRRELILRGSYDYSQRDSTTPGEDFENSLFMLSTRIQF